VTHAAIEKYEIPTRIQTNIETTYAWYHHLFYPPKSTWPQDLTYCECDCDVLRTSVMSPIVHTKTKLSGHLRGV
jgi:hypothetical protein